MHLSFICYLSLLLGRFMAKNGLIKGIYSHLSIHTLVGRFLLIFLTPIVMLQCVNSYMFYQRHWDNVTNKMQLMVAEEVGIICNLIQNKKDFQRHKAALKPLTIELSLQEANHYKPRSMDKVSGKKKLKQYIAMLNGVKPAKSIKDIVLNKGEVDAQLLDLKDKISYKISQPFSIYYTDDSANIIAEVLLTDAVLSLRFSSKRIQSPTANVFIAWMIGASILLYAIAILFMRNQLRSISQLAQFADGLGKGHQMESFVPSGATEIKNAGEAIILMRDRISRQINYRTEMLAHISHDLRTPLTRIKLQTSMLKDKNVVEQLDHNINEIESMIVGYLNFAKEEGNEIAGEVDIKKLLEEIVTNYDNKRISLVSKRLLHSHVCIRKYAMKRAIDNLIGNALKHYKERVLMGLRVDERELLIWVEDDGEGLNKSLYQQVFNPFFKAKKNSEGHGLGLTIVKSIVQSHGGKVTLSKSSLGGLKVEINIPI